MAVVMRAMAEHHHSGEALSSEVVMEKEEAAMLLAFKFWSWIFGWVAVVLLGVPLLVLTVVTAAGVWGWRRVAR